MIRKIIEKVYNVIVAIGFVLWALIVIGVVGVLAAVLITAWLLWALICAVILGAMIATGRTNPEGLFRAFNVSKTLGR